MIKETKKPKAKIVGQDGNVFNLIAICSKALKKAGLHTEAKEMTQRCFGAQSYHSAIGIMGEYCELY